MVVERESSLAGRYRSDVVAEELRADTCADRAAAGTEPFGSPAVRLEERRPLLDRDVVDVDHGLGHTRLRENELESSRAIYRHADDGVNGQRCQR